MRRRSSINDYGFPNLPEYNLEVALGRIVALETRFAALESAYSLTQNLAQVAYDQSLSGGGPSLRALTLSSLAFTAGTAFSVTIGNATSGSTITATASDGTALSVDGNTASGTFTAAGEPDITLTESFMGIVRNTVLPAVITSGGVIVPPTPTPILPNYATIVTFGDSITVGLNSTSTANSWAGRVAAAVGATLLNSGVSGTVLQKSVGGPNNPAGSTQPYANNGRSRFLTATLGTNKRAAVFSAYGFNDARMNANPSVFNATAYANDYREIINGWIIGGYALADIYVASPYYITDTGLGSSVSDPDYRTQNRAGFETYVAAAAAVAAEFGVKYCDLYAYLRDNGYPATVDTDNIHPLNAGHAIIATGWQTQTVVANTRAAPPSVTATVSTTTITVVASAVSGAASYEYTLVVNPVNYATNTTGVFTSTPVGDYYAKARAVFSDGSKGPWAFTANAVSVASSGSGVTFFQDNFDGASGSSITGHTSDSGATWAVQTGYTPSTASALDGNGGMYATSSSAYRTSASPGTPNYYVEARAQRIATLTGTVVGITARADAAANTLYFFQYTSASGGFQLFKSVAGTSTQLGTTITTAWTDAEIKTFRLTCDGSTISGSVNGTTILSVTDTGVTASGSVGVRGGGSATPTTGTHFLDMVAVTL